MSGSNRTLYINGSIIPFPVGPILVNSSLILQAQTITFDYTVLTVEGNLTFVAGTSSVPTSVNITNSYLNIKHNFIVEPYVNINITPPSNGTSIHVSGDLNITLDSKVEVDIAHDYDALMQIDGCANLQGPLGLTLRNSSVTIPINIAKTSDCLNSGFSSVKVELVDSSCKKVEDSSLQSQPSILAVIVHFSNLECGAMALIPTLSLMSLYFLMSLF